MKTRLTKSVALLATTCLSVFFMISCSNDEKVQTATSSQFVAAGRSADTVRNLGYYHNEGLGSVLADLQTHVPLTASSAHTYARQSGYAYLTHTGLGTWDPRLDNVYYSTFDLNYNAAPTLNTSPVNLYTNFSPALKTELLKLDDSLGVYADKGQFKEFYDYTVTIIDRIPSTLTNATDRQAWQSAVMVAGYSALYWNDHIIDWLALNPHYVPTPPALQTLGWWHNIWVKIKKYVIADAAGAASGALEGLIGGGPGVLLGALGGGVGGSVGLGVEQSLSSN